MKFSELKIDVPLDPQAHFDFVDEESETKKSGSLDNPRLTPEEKVVRKEQERKKRPRHKPSFFGQDFQGPRDSIPEASQPEKKGRWSVLFSCLK